MPFISKSTPDFPSWSSWLLPMGRRSHPPASSSLPALTLCQIERRFAPAIPASMLGQNASSAHSRERVFTLARTFWCWIWQALQPRSSCREVVRQVQALFAIHDARCVDAGTSAFCQARSKLPKALLEKLFAQSFRSAELAARTTASSLLQNRPIRVVDASGARLCDTPANRAAYPPSSNLLPGTGFPYLRIVVLFCLASGALLARATGCLHQSELRLFLEVLPLLGPNDILLADRAYGQFVIAALLRDAGIDLISTVATRRRKVDFRSAKKRLGHHDALFVWKKPSSCSALVDPARWASLPQEITVRLLRVRLQRRGFRTEHFVVVTTLLDPVVYPAHEILATHARRWRMEMCLDDLKTTLGMESLRCQHPATLEKELLIFLTAHNLIRWLLLQSSTQFHVSPETLSFKGALDAFRQWCHAMAGHLPRRLRLLLWDRLLGSIAADTLPYRPNRHEPRAVKKSRSKYPPLNKPRRLYIERWSRGKRRRVTTALRHSLN